MVCNEMRRVFFNRNRSTSRPTTPQSPTKASSDKLYPSETNSSLESLNSKETNYKTQHCRTFRQQGYCEYDRNCRFAHGDHELRITVNYSKTSNPKYKTRLCRNFETRGSCQYGVNCQFIHQGTDQIDQNQQKPMINIFDLSRIYHNHSTSIVDNLVLPPQQRFQEYDIGPQSDPFACLTWNRNIVK